MRTHERLVGTSTTGDDTDHTTDGGRDDLLGSGWELDASLALIWVVANDGNVVSGGTSKSTTVTDLLLNVGDDGSFWDLADWEDVADGQSSVLSGVDELSGVHALVGDEGLGVKLEAVWVAENDLGERSTTSWVVDDILHDTTDVTVTLSIIEVTKCGWGNTETLVGGKDRSATFTLVANNTTHLRYQLVLILLPVVALAALANPASSMIIYDCVSLWCVAATIVFDVVFTRMSSSLCEVLVRCRAHCKVANCRLYEAGYAAPDNSQIEAAYLVGDGLVVERLLSCRRGESSLREGDLDRIGSVRRPKFSECAWSQ